MHVYRYTFASDIVETDFEWLMVSYGDPHDWMSAALLSIK